jgi:hypothetical protein
VRGARIENHRGQKDDQSSHVAEGL